MSRIRLLIIGSLLLLLNTVFGAEGTGTDAGGLEDRLEDRLGGSREVGHHSRQPTSAESVVLADAQVEDDHRYYIQGDWEDSPGGGRVMPITLSAKRPSTHAFARFQYDSNTQVLDVVAGFLDADAWGVPGDGKRLEMAWSHTKLTPEALRKVTFLPGSSKGLEDTARRVRELLEADAQGTPVLNMTRPTGYDRYEEHNGWERTFPIIIEDKDRPMEAWWKVTESYEGQAILDFAKWLNKEISSVAIARETAADGDRISYALGEPGVPDRKPRRPGCLGRLRACFDGGD